MTIQRERTLQTVLDAMEQVGQLTPSAASMIRIQHLADMDRNFKAGRADAGGGGGDHAGLSGHH